MSYEIEKGVPVKNFQKGSKYPFTEMGAGDSFFVPLEDGDTSRNLQCKIHQSIRFALNKIEGNARFITRKTEKNGVTGIRVYRIA